MSVTRYHISPKGPRICDAQIGTCHYDKSGFGHFNDFEKAEATFHKALEDEFGLSGRAVSQKVSRRPVQVILRNYAKLEKRSRVVRLLSRMRAALVYEKNFINTRSDGMNRAEVRRIRKSQKAGTKRFLKHMEYYNKTPKAQQIRAQKLAEAQRQRRRDG